MKKPITVHISNIRLFSIEYVDYGKIRHLPKKAVIFFKITQKVGEVSLLEQKIFWRGTDKIRGDEIERKWHHDEKKYNVLRQFTEYVGRMLSEGPKNPKLARNIYNQIVNSTEFSIPVYITHPEWKKKFGKKANFNTIIKDGIIAASKKKG